MKPILSPKCVSTTILSVDFDSVPKPTAILLVRPVYEELQCVECGDAVTLVSSQSFLLNTKRLENSIGYDSTKRLVDTALRCILFHFYIKPQLFATLTYNDLRCILFHFYIKPQRT